MRVFTFFLIAAALAFPAAASSATTILHLTATGAMHFDKKALTALAGKVTIVLKNRSILSHNVAIKGNGINIKGRVVGRGGTSTVTAKLRPGKYEFYCSVPGHAQAGMKGTLTIR